MTNTKLTTRGTTPRRTRALAATLFFLLGAGAVGCELALDFDRTKIDGGAIDASFGDTATTDQASPPADGTTDGGGDTGADTGTDTGADTGRDTGADTGSDGGDGGTDGGADAADADDGAG
jgi:hypothetical protein